MQRVRYISIALAIGLLVLFVAPTLLVTVTADPPDPTPQPMSATPVSEDGIPAAEDDPSSPIGSLAYPDDPTSNFSWSAGYSGVADIQTAFNNARANENLQLGISLPMLTLPSQTEWDAISDGEKALWLINHERIDRSVHPLHGLEANVTSVAQYYAQYLMDHDAFGHSEDGHNPWERLDTNPAIGACHDLLTVAENLYAFMSGGTSIPLPVERAVYWWMYEDNASGWGHRHTILWFNYNENSGPADREGFLGIGRASGGPYQGYPFAEIIVMNVFDPCSTWDYAPPTAPSGLAATPVPPTRINLSWTDNSDNEDGFKIERSPDGATWTQIDTVGANVTTYSNTGLTCDQTYYYRVRAYNTQGDSGYSNTASAMPSTGYTGDTYEPDNICTNAKPITVNGAAQHRNFHAASDEDWVQFTVTANEPYTITTSSLDTGNDTVLYLYDTDGTTELAQNDDCPGGGPESCINNWSDPDSGTYFIRVRNRYDNGSCAGYGYDLRVVDSSGGVKVYLPIVFKTSMANWYITNNTGGTLTVQLSGFGTKSFGGGTSLWVVPSGWHDVYITTTGCGGVIDDTYYFTPGGDHYNTYVCN